MVPLFCWISSILILLLLRFLPVLALPHPAIETVPLGSRTLLPEMIVLILSISASPDMGSSSAFKGYYIPYNSLLLFKMLRGDTSDNISAVIVKNKAGKVLKFGKKTYSELVEKMEADGVDFANTFRYVAITADNRSDEEYRAEVGAYFDKTIKPVLAGYFEEEAIQGMRYNYIGMNLRAVSADLQCLTQIPLETLNPTYLKYGIHIR